MSKSNISGLIVSAGLSARMNRFKPLAIYKGDTFINNIISKLETVCNDIIIVTGNKADELKNETIKKNSGSFNELKFVHNDDYKKGMFTSLQRGVYAAKDCDWIIYHFVDQPGLPVHFYKDFISQIDDNHNWIQPANNSKKGHPIILGKNIFDSIVSESATSNLRSLSKNDLFKKKYWECNYLEIFQDIDTEEEYRNLN